MTCTTSRRPLPVRLRQESRRRRIRGGATIGSFSPVLGAASSPAMRERRGVDRQRPLEASTRSRPSRRAACALRGPRTALPVPLRHSVERHSLAHPALGWGRVGQPAQARRRSHSRSPAQVKVPSRRSRPARRFRRFRRFGRVLWACRGRSTALRTDRTDRGSNREELRRQPRPLPALSRQESTRVIVRPTNVD